MAPSVLKSTARPRITTILAMSADGKISDRFRTAARFPSVADQAHLERCLATADATLFGAGTLRAYGTTALVKDPALLAKRRQQQLSQPIHIVCSRSGQLDPTARFFSQPVPRWLLTTPTGAKNWYGQNCFERIWPAPTMENSDRFDWLTILSELKTLDIHHLVLMGGGELVAALLAMDVIDELRLTICPLIVGGRQAPTPCDGDGFSLASAPGFILISNQTVGDEVFLHYRRQR